MKQGDHQAVFLNADAVAVKGHVTNNGKPFSATQVQRLMQWVDLAEAQAV
jgi:hypothetical protein